MITSVNEFYEVANRLLHGINPNCDCLDAIKVKDVINEMNLKKRRDGRYREQIYKWFMEHPFENYFKEDLEDTLVGVDKWVVDKDELFKLTSPYNFQPLTEYRRWKDSRYLISNNGILYDMLYHHQEKMYISKDNEELYYWKDDNSETKITSVEEMLRVTFGIRKKTFDEVMMEILNSDCTEDESSIF